MAEDPQKVAQRRLSQSTVAPGVILGLDTMEAQVARPKKRKAEVEGDDESSSKKAKKEKKDQRDKKNRKVKKDKKEKKEKKVRKDTQVEDDDVTSDPNKNGEMRESILDSGIDTSEVHNIQEPSKTKKRKKDKAMSYDCGEEVKKKKKSKKSKDKLDSGEASANTVEVGESADRRDKKNSKKSKKTSTIAAEG